MARAELFSNSDQPGLNSSWDLGDIVGKIWVEAAPTPTIEPRKDASAGRNAK
jgi:hypothetical protein